MRGKPTTSILPYLREKAAQAAKEKAPEGKPEAEGKAPKLDEYNKARLAICRGAE